MAPQQCSRECQQRCFSLSSGLQALNHVLDGAESGGLHHERMCGAAELMSNTRMHRASKQKHHLDNLVPTPLPWLHGVPCGPPKPLQPVYEGGL